MAHEGLDEWVSFWFGQEIKALNLDGLTIFFFGLVALAICFYFRRAILKHKVMLPFLILGGICLYGTVLFHLLEGIHIFIEVAEESIKILGVSMFFCGYLVTLLSFLEGLSITPISERKD